MEEHDFDWTVMIYLSGDNNLSSEMLWAITEIEKAAEKKSRRVALTVQYDPLAPGVGALRYAVGRYLPAQISQAAKDLGFPAPFKRAFEPPLLPNEDAASSESLRDFIRWSTKKFPSTTYRMLILSGHGSGADGDFLTDDNPGAGGPVARAVAPAAGNLPAVDATRLLQPGSLTIPGLGKALLPPESGSTPAPEMGGQTFALAAAPKAATTIDVLGMDSCLMSTLEVAHEVSAAVKFLVASEGFIPNTGWPYADVIALFGDKETEERREQRGEPQTEPLTAEALSRAIVTTCAEYYSVYLPAGVSIDIAATECGDKMPPLIQKMSTLSDVLTRGMVDQEVQNAVILAHWRAQSFKFEQYTDLWDFCDVLYTEIGRYSNNRCDIRDACHKVMRAIDDALGVPAARSGAPASRGRQQSVGVDFQYARGLSVYFPWSLPTGAGASLFEQYSKLRFATETHWGSFLRTYLENTQRPPRPDGAARVPFPPGGPIPMTPAAHVKNVAGYNKNVAGYNKFLAQVFGNNLPWCAKNPPQQVFLS